MKNMANSRECSTRRMFERLTSEDCDLWYTEERPRRPLLYDSKGGSDRRARRRTDTDIRYLTDVLTAEQQVSHSSDAANSETRNDFSLSGEKYSDSSPQTTVSRRKNTSEFSKQRRQTVSVDGIYFAKRVMSVEDNGVSNLQVAESEYLSDGDEFFLATDFDTPLPKLMYTQSVDYLDSLIRKEQHSHLDSTRRCLSEYDIQDMAVDAEDYASTLLEKDVSQIATSSSLIDLSAENLSSFYFDDDVESLPSESPEGESWNGDMCPSPLDLLYNDLDQWTPSHDPDVIHSAREAREFTHQAVFPSNSYRSKSEPFLLGKRKSLSQSMLADSLDMDDIECHQSFRQKIRAALGLEQVDHSKKVWEGNSSSNSADTSLSFCAPHRKTNEPLHSRLRRVLSSVSVEEDLPYDITVSSLPVAAGHKKDRERTKSVPAKVDEFVNSYKELYYERSKSAELLNHHQSQSAFKIYHDDLDSVAESETMQFSGEERFIDSPLVVDYQLGLRTSPPTSSQSYTSAVSPIVMSAHTAANSKALHQPDHCDGKAEPIFPKTLGVNEPLTPVQIDKTLGFWNDDIIERHKEAVAPCKTDRLRTESCDEEVRKALFCPDTYNVVRAEPVILSTPVQDRNSVVHATPVMIGTPTMQLPAASDTGSTIEMGPPTQTYSSTPPSKSGLPLKAFSLGVTTLGASSNASFSPQDSLAETDGKSTGYFLQFAQEKTPSPGKSKAAPKATKLPARNKVTGPKTPTRYPSGTPAQRTKLTKQQQAHKVLPNRPVVKKVTSKELRQSPAQQADNKKHRGRPGKYLPKDGYRTRSVSPKVIGRRRRSSSPKPSGFRTRSISPKILKKEDLSKGLGKEDMLTVVDKCNNLLKNLTNEKEFLDAESFTLKSEQTIVNNCDSATAVCIDQPDSLSTIANEITDKRTNIDTNNAPSDKTHSNIQQVRPTTFIDAIEDNCINNEDISCESSFPSINIVTLPSTNIATLSADTSDTSSANTVDTVPNSDEWNTTEIKENTKHSSNDNNLTFHSLTGCQEERQPERDLHLDHEKIDDELSVAVPKSHGEVEDLKTNLDTPNLHSVSQSCKVESLSHSQNLPAEGIPANMASSWMDRLKEDLDNDEEWLSEEEEFQREQEEKLRAAAQRAALAQAESSSEDEQVGLRRPQSIPKKTDSRRDYHDDSLDSSDEEHQGFKYNHRNFAVRKSMNRPSYSTEDYSSEEELTMSSGARGGRAPPEPNHDEMDFI